MRPIAAMHADPSTYPCMPVSLCSGVTVGACRSGAILSLHSCKVRQVHLHPTTSPSSPTHTLSHPQHSRTHTHTARAQKSCGLCSKLAHTISMQLDMEVEVVAALQPSEASAGHKTRGGSGGGGGKGRMLNPGGRSGKTPPEDAVGAAPPPCEDNLDICEWLSMPQRGYCRGIRDEYWWMASQCRRSCKLCGVQAPGADPLSPSHTHAHTHTHTHTLSLSLFHTHTHTRTQPRPPL
jgi:hypothetical protein